MSDFHFLYPWRLLGLLLCPLLYFLSQRSASGWHRIMEKPFAAALIKGQRLRARNVLPWLIGFGVLALAAPSWQRDLPAAFTPENNVMVILQQDISMLAQDLPPNRHQRMQQKIAALMSQMPGSHFGLVVYSANAWLTTPLTSDADFFTLFLQAQQPTLVPQAQGSGLARAVALAQKNLPQAADAPRAIILVADHLTSQEVNWLQQQDLPLQIWVPGTANGGKLPDEFAAQGIDTRLNVKPFEQARDAGMPVTLVSAEDDDLDVVRHNIQQSVTAQQNSRTDLQWKNSGYLLVIPMLILLLVWRQQLLCLLVFTLPLILYSPDSSASLLDAWVRPDVQGQLAFKRGDYHAAAQHFQDPLRRGIALYYAEDYVAALGAFQQAAATAESLLWIGNCYAQQKSWQQALNSYDQALSLKPDWLMAQQNRAKIARIIMQLRQKERDRQADQHEQKDEDPDAIKHDLKREQGVNQLDLKPVAGAAPSAEQWYNNLTLSPGGLLENLYHSAPAEAP
ncbi:Ca-activated chloride channel family protein [Candidatus Pantoea symbiotica]|jgi:Ca-activated chloride channel family protein|uniref:Ca-activated chloride channel family protein n=1 Tax=Candidatus Pantoea symbiotica TaxID=1884370 RepID=A0A1I3ZZM0_9GAMM|nr:MULTISPECIES: VWA domain-containing protein [Pantoea]KAJ9430199.1 VWA domain-containing protein [Pantoea sp. YR343]MRT25860.1 VWA domain-containing protein [Enterobacteriaceae bacterium RIT697]SFK49555.1 Ca-activated chloride channel family protein [Pantoea symbiotica]SFU91099.1 Ca-activated chloride channel family protein [Pantoea sp. YR525]